MTEVDRPVYRAKFKYLEGWIDDELVFSGRAQAEKYALGVANQDTKVIDFDVVEEPAELAASYKPDAEDVWFAFYGKEISIHQLRAMLRDLGWTDEEIDDGLDDAEDENER